MIMRVTVLDLLSGLVAWAAMVPRLVALFVRFAAVRLVTAAAFPE